jgi:ParB family chromosome partitioning protein
MISIRFFVIALDAIDQQDHTFKISIDKDSTPLSESIQHLGLITPPLLCQKKTGYGIVSGFRRIAACRKLQFVRIRAGVIAGAAEPLACAQTAIAENSFQRELNLVEISRALNLLARFVTAPVKIEAIAASLGLPDHSAIIHKIQKIQKLPAAMQDAIVNNRISLDMALKLSSLNADDGRVLLEIFHALSLGRNKQKELLTHIQEIAIRDDIAIDRLLASKDIQDILADHETDRTQKTKSLRDFLRKRRYPHLYFAEKEFFDSLNKIKLGNRISLRPADYFEGDSFSLHLSFKDLNELKSHIKILDQITQNPLLIDLLDKK